MSEVGDAFLSPAQERPAGAESEYDNARYKNAANRAYFACFHAAIAALELVNVRPPSGKREWTHVFVQGQFPGLLINRRKLYPAEMRDARSQTRRLRQHADYDGLPVTRTEAARSLSRARDFVAGVASRGGATT